MPTVAESIIKFYTSLKPPRNLPEAVEILHPQAEEQVIEVVKTFYKKYYNDNGPRQLLFGINPGRFGAGTTGVNFTGPKQLTEFCHISHPFGKRSELSAEFIYDMINAYGGPEKFYSRFFITSISPLGFVKEGINLNYYDDKALAAGIRPWIVDTIKKQLKFAGSSKKCICIGGEKNYKYFSSINDELRFFSEIIPLPHPRFIMQYKRKQKSTYIDAYLKALDEII
ncbi:MAG TPA: uracil-DNA glycosylase family protein [Chitinophagaceae bacterium]|nr:uracil-DNA glycosylase family protein [Chitinophagaceae bacterium]